MFDEPTGYVRNGFSNQQGMFVEPTLSVREKTSFLLGLFILVVVNVADVRGQTDLGFCGVSISFRFE